MYDDWNLIAILDSQSSILQSFTWGLDLSGSMQGAGGVGGLLAVNDAASGTNFVAYDGNGNVAALVHPVRYGSKILLRVCAAKRQGQRVLYRLYPRPARTFSASSGRRCALHTRASPAHLGLLRSLPRSDRRNAPGKIFEDSLGETISQEPNEELSHGIHPVRYARPEQTLTEKLSHGVKATDGTVSANYEYGPFGELVRATGLMAKANPFRFSTKYQDDETDLLYYGYRFYNASAGRWLSRDPIQEDGGLNLVFFIRNDGVNTIDILGLVLPPGGGPFPPLPPFPPNKPPKDNPCEGYKKHMPASKCTCNCQSVGDAYPERAYTVCKGFLEKYHYSEASQCVARCLAGVEGGAGSLKWCSLRATVRLAAHVACYAKCGFVPDQIPPFPPGGLDVGVNDLLKTLVKCRDPWNQAR